jgi:hypothetical protein
VSSRVRNMSSKALGALGDRRAAVNVPWIGQLTGATGESIGNVLAELEELVDVEAEIRRRHLEGGRPHYAQIRAPFELYAFTRLLRPDHVLETGVSSGVSSSHFLLALRKNRRGTLHSIDLPTFQKGEMLAPTESHVSLPPGTRTGWAIPPKLRAGWDLRLGPSQHLLPQLVEELPSVGLFLHDSLHTPTHLTFELTTVRPKLTPGAVVLADNTMWTGQAFPRFATALGVPVARRGRSDLVGLRAPLA